MEIKELEEKIRDCRIAINRYQERIDKQTIYPEAKLLIGKCFKYRNCYSCPQKQSDYWWLYCRVIKANGSMLRVESFEVDKYGKFNFEERSYFARTFAAPTNYLPIKASTYRQCRDKFVSQLIKKMAKLKRPGNGKSGQ